MQIQRRLRASSYLARKGQMIDEMRTMNRGVKLHLLIIKNLMLSLDRNV